ncbi:DUF4388 domain-containing protein [Lusitaniella coriacea LEGE 07157]|uniref:DUF4388 domain-containing protein n=1 Tax=Lusitaniella coriacea LEGE 07157 TaxID=945747 RepID=A0A8J7DY90_9CYAN|nr:response regulator [Lusitaniella coriacea]MBE9117320.1 DUF4388 domain-containing protein [Lusitaniella coriacea LEGE 07157]
MQGTLNEIDIRSILQLIELGQRTGELFVETYNSPLLPPPIGENAVTATFTQDSSSRIDNLQTPGSFWLVFFVNGQIAYAADRSNNSLQRLRDYLRRYRVEHTVDRLSDTPTASINTAEYAYLWLLMENRVLTPIQGRTIIQSMIKETLFDLLSLHQGIFNFEMGCAIAPQLTTLEIASLVTIIMKQIQQWKQFYPLIYSPAQCPVLTEKDRLRQALPSNAYNGLDIWADGQTSLRQLSRYLNRDLVTIARAIYPYIKQGWIQLLDAKALPHFSFGNTASQPLPTAHNRCPHVICIDDDITIGKSVEYILRPQGYQTTLVNNPLEAFHLVFKIHPDLILCDIAMPDVDGYEVCAMLRSSTTFRQTPIVMLTGKESFIDRARARMVGSTDYLTKPFGESELLMLIEKYVGLGTASVPPMKPFHPENQT